MQTLNALIALIDGFRQSTKAFFLVGVFIIGSKCSFFWPYPSAGQAKNEHLLPLY
jgi:hypothetical protein